MTVKRFELCEINCFDYGVEAFNEIMDNGVPLSQKQVCEFLNELHEENQLLKLQVETKLFSRRELEKENEQLKKRIKELELLNNGLNYALQNVRKIDVEIDVGDKK